MSDEVKCCAECGGSLSAMKWGADYCSDRCKMRAYRKRKRGEVPSFPVHVRAGSLVHPPIKVVEWESVGGFHTVLVPDEWSLKVAQMAERAARGGDLISRKVVELMRPLLFACGRAVDVIPLDAPSPAKQVRNKKAVKKRAVKTGKKGAKRKGRKDA